MSVGCRHGYLPPCTFCADDRLRAEHIAMKAELSRIRTALEEIKDKKRPYPSINDYNAGCIDAYNQCAAIAERALTAGSGK